MNMRAKIYSTADSSETQRERDNRALARRSAAEGIVLLKNENGLLPLAKGAKLALFGGGASQTVKGGTGSGDVNERDRVSIAQGLERSGIRITTKRWLAEYDRLYHQARRDWRDILLAQASEDGHTFFHIYAAHPFLLPDGRLMDQRDVEESQTDTAAYVISRIAGEGADRKAEKGDYYLTDAQLAALRFLCGSYTHVILIINTGAQIDLSFLKELPAIESVVYMVQAGMEGGSALADVLTGVVTPSGKLADTWAAAYQDYPASAAFSHNNGDVQREVYSEGIYVGYRYFDSFDVEPLYPFGFGLSYTEFALEAGKVTVDIEKQAVSVTVRVKNTGSRWSGREVVQVYAASPQTGLPKERRRLCGFAKTELLAPGAETEAAVTFPVKALASFDTARAAWVVEKGVYSLFVGNSSRNVVLTAGLSVAADGVVEQVPHICPLQETLDEYCRPDQSAVAFAEDCRRELEARALPVLHLEVLPEKRTGLPASETLEKARALTEQLTDDELIHMVVGEISRGQGSAGALGAAGIAVPGAAGETSSILEEKYGIPGLTMADGPAGLRLNRTYEVSRKTGKAIPADFFAAFEGGFFVEPQVYEDSDTHYQYCTAFPVGMLLAQTWDPALLEEVGRAVGREMQEFGITWWLAPGMNIHRDPLCGRNFEYFSEDPLVSGIMSAALTRGVQSLGGIGTTIKHFACNNQEDNRMGSNSIVSERALREIYLRGFEIAVKTSQPMAIMTSYNLINGVHAANSLDLCTQVARREWGFAGIIMTDWTTTSLDGGSIPWKCAAAGNDLIMPGGQRDLDNLAEALKNGDLDRGMLRDCAARLISIACQSNCHESA